MSRKPPVAPVLMSVCLGFALPAWAEAPKRAETGNQTVFSIPVGPNDVSYADEGREELKPWGPAGFTVAKDGSFWVADTAGNRIVRYSSRGDRLQAYSLDELLIGAVDVEVKDNNEVVVLGEYGYAPSIIRMNELGRLVGRHDLSRDAQHRGLTGIELDERGEVLAVREGGSGQSRVVANGAKSELMDLPQVVHNGKRFTSRGGDLKASSRQGYSLGYVVAGDARVDVEVPNFLGGLNVLAANPDGSFYVVVEEVAFGDTIRVDQTVRHYGADGAFLGAARVPISERYTAVENGLTVDRKGQVYALITRPQSVEVQRLAFQSKLTPILPETSVEPAAEEDSFNTTSCLRTRTEVKNDANAYLGLSTYLTSTNTDGYCAGRRKPRYIGGAGTYPSMPYKWGGWDTGALYQDGMAAGRQAGDICGDGTCDSDPVLSCARGMDCSGFVTRVWRRTDKKYGTSTLSEISTAIAKSNIALGDILNKSGSHVVVFEKNTSTGLYIWEETKTNSYDRVVYRHTAWSTWDAYTARRYNYIC